MGTRIYITPSGVDLCQPEYTKIVAHSFAMGISESNALFYGGNNSPSGQATWSRDIYDYYNSRFAPFVSTADKTVGIPLPINLVADDIVTLSGTAYFNNTQRYINAGWEVYFSLGVFHFDCTSNNNPETPAFTFIPVATYPITAQTKGSICFEEMVTLNSNFDIHETRLLVGFSVYAFCPEGEECMVPPIAEPDLATVSYTFDIERPCAVITSESNFIIKNCCEPLITELVNIPGLQVGSFHVDDEGNCWEVIEASTDVTNFTRNFVDTYTSCVECQDANLCPENLMIESCCLQGVERVTGSLPGLEVGDTFVDNNGLCWRVSDTTGGPISEESITVDTIIPGECGDCTTANPCPDFWFVESCCTKISEIIATTVPLNPGDSFVDTNGICWSVVEGAQQLPTNYSIVVDTVYTGGSQAENCETCTITNPCPTEYFLTVRACCDNDRIEVISVPSEFMSFYEGSIFRDGYTICWEVMSYSTTGVETYALNWLLFQDEIFQDCFTCNNFGGVRGGCRTLWQVRDCNTNIIYTALFFDGALTVGSYYAGVLESTEYESCFEVLGYGYPQNDPFEIFIGSDSIEYVTCEECVLQGLDEKILELQPCCGGSNIIVDYNGPWTNGIGGVAYLNHFANDGGSIGRSCYTLIGLSSGPVTSIGYYTLNSDFSNCSSCTQEYPCE